MAARQIEAMRRAANYLPILITAFCIRAMIVQGPIPQTENYHAFADETSFLGIPHARDVLSNLGFACVGLWGLLGLWRHRRHHGIAADAEDTDAADAAA